jgi:hypothetical protein
MQKHVKVYMNNFQYGETEFMPCEACQKPAVDIHHINGRGKGKDVISNLMALCRNCHIKAHSTESKSNMQYIHNMFLAGVRKQFLK